MRLKQRVGDFHVRELLNDDVIQPSGQHMVYRVTKKKLTTPEAVRILAEEAGVQTGDIAFCGLKDRQGVTTQYMSVQAKHREVQLSEQGLRIEPAGWVDEPLSSAVSRGNAFEVTVRALRGRDIHVLRQNIEAVREHGLVNYFDDQRFGNLRHEQGWVARELMRGNYEEGLKRMLFWPSPFDSDRYEKFKGDIGRNWGRWDKCAGIARGFGEHFSIFDHLHEHPDDFAGAFYHAPSRIRLIHLYAYQSHVWNRAAALLVRDAVAKDERVIIPSDEGALPSHATEAPGALVAKTSLRLPGSHLADAGEDREVYDKVLAAEDMTADDFHIEGVPGFALKGEDRPLIITPGHLRVRPAEEDRLNRGMRSVRLRFELGRGSYATLVVKRLFESLEREQADAEEGEGFRGPRPERGFRGDRAGGPRGGREDREGGYRGGRGGGFQRGGDDRQRGGYRDRRGHRRDEGELQGGEGYRRERAERPERGRGEDGRGFRRERGDGGGGFRRDGGPRREGGGRGGWGGGRGGDRREGGGRGYGRSNEGGGRGYGRSGDGGRGGEGGERREGGYRREGARNEGGGYGRGGGRYQRDDRGGQGGGRYQRDDRGGRGRYSRDDRGGEGGFKREGGGRSFNKGGKRFDREGGGRRFDKDDKQRERPTPPKDGESPWGSGGGDAS